MSDKDFNMFNLTSGLPLDGARCHAVEATFTYNQEYAADAVVLDITWQPVDEDGEEAGEAKHQLYSVGKNWEPADEGATVEHGSGKPMNFNNGTNIGKLIHSLMEARGDGDATKGLAVLVSEMDDSGQPDNVAFWIGMDVTLKSIQYKTQNGKESSTFGIGEFHGRVGEEVEAKPKAKTATKVAPKASGKPAAKAAAKANDATGEDAWKEHLGPKLYRTLVKLAVDADDHDSFMDQAFALDDVTSDDKAWNKATEKIIMVDDEDGLFGTARADG
jgi:hypothetical protein